MKAKNEGPIEKNGTFVFSRLVEGETRPRDTLAN